VCISASRRKNECSVLEGKINIKFCVELGRTATDTFAIPSKAHGGEVMKTSSVYLWHKRLQDGRDNMEYVDITYEGNVHKFLRYEGKCSL
jgi:uncharacterized cysteine cluster protein YcgN (CxxCxxCC family)